MANESQDTKQSEYMKGGKGRKDEVGGSGIYPASAPNAPADAELRTEGELVGHKGPRDQPVDEQGSPKVDQRSGSE